ncbi:site-specific integrase [Lentilitoribacter sp. Alg239-R112]|uniref:tyrosine-type recombinase/integrase n=1 Tax=Lentilitoribacter sp. Alg239-R112 TaxID=2305987 RepID=UPI0013A70A2E|nr:site-specific integrase [Lentilitoribacter sp. Alg239-R112]
MTKKRLTKKVVDNLVAKERDYVEWCGALAGFGCRVRKSGTKTFIAMYRIGGRNAPVKRVTIGPYGKLTVEEARSMAGEVLAKARLGEDVAEIKAKERAQLTMTQLCDEYLEHGCDLKKASTIATDKGRIEGHIKPLLGTKQIGKIKRTDIQKFLRDVATGKTARDKKTGKFGRSIIKGGKGTATRTVRLLGGILSYAVQQGYIETNPRTGVKLYPDNKGQRFLSEEELQRLGDTMREAETIGLPWIFNEGKKTKHRPKIEENRREIISPHAVAAVRLILLTGCRVGEILKLRWNEVDFERGLLHLPDSKTGAKPVVLAAPALEVLSTLPRTDDYVISGAIPGKPRSDLKRPWQRICNHAKLEGVRLHDLRHTYASVGAMSGMGLGVVGKLLGHQTPETTAQYSHFADDPLRRASETIGGSIAAALAGGNSSNVIDLTQHKKGS